MGRIIGIDLGTTNCVVSEYKMGRTSIIEINKSKTTPSVVLLDGNNVIVGSEAKKMIEIYPEKILQSTKRDMGTSVVYQIGDKTLTPVDAASMILSYLKSEAEKTLKEEVKDVVITIPAYFGQSEKDDTKKAAIKAGLNPRVLLPEPTSAAISYGFDKSLNQLLLVIDLGGGTFDVSILEVEFNEQTGTSEYIVKAVDGNHKLGGDDFDNAIVEFMKEEGATGCSDYKLKEEAERAKIQLSQMNKTTINIPSIGFSVVLTREVYKELIKKYLDEIIDRIKKTVQSSGKDFDDINRFVLVGGSCKHPVVQDAIKSITQRDPYIASNMDTVVAEGAAIRHHIDLMPVGDVVIKDVLSHAIGTDVRNILTNETLNVTLLRKNQSYPAKQVILAYVDEGQQICHSHVIEGSGRLAKDAENTFLGELTINLDPQYQSSGHPIVTVYDLDNSGMLYFTNYEIPRNSTTEFDILHLEKLRDDETLIIPFDVWEEFEAKHESVIKKKTVVINGAVRK